jgi:hypothetical protein
MQNFDEPIFDQYEIDITILDVEVISTRNPRHHFRPAAILVTSKQDRTIIDCDLIDSRELATAFDFQQHIQHVIENYMARKSETPQEAHSYCKG